MYGRSDSNVRVVFSEARVDVSDAIGKAAAEHDVAHVLVAGDLFDTGGPEAERQDRRTMTTGEMSKLLHNYYWENHILFSQVLRFA